MRMSRRLAALGGKRYLVLFDSTKGGDQTSVTGGWTGAGSGPTSSISIGTTILCKHKRDDNESNSVTIKTVNSLDFYRYSSIHVLSKRTPETTYERVLVNGTQIAYANTVQETVIDISGITAATQVTVKQGGQTGFSFTITTEIYKIWLER